jgi:hypothetical protein
MRVRTNNTAAGALKNNTIYKVVGDIREGGYFNFIIPEHKGFLHTGILNGDDHIDGGNWIIVSDFENRDFLRDFVSLNQIKTTLVSKQLGKSKGWLTQVMNRTDRGDLSDQELQSIMKQLHVDWTNTQYVHVKATKTHSAYRTRPCVYEHAKHKELLQRAFWDGRFVGVAQ